MRLVDCLDVAFLLRDMFCGVTFVSLLILIMADTSGSNGRGADAAFAAGSDVPQLPPPDSNSKDIPTIKLGETIRFEEWGPIILNTDGSTRKISNWDQLTEQEKDATWRRISKRNEQRRKILVQQQRQQDGQEAKDL